MSRGWLHAKTFGPDGSYPLTLCGLKDNQVRRFCSAAQLIAHRERDGDDTEACPECLDVVNARGQQGPQ